MATATTKIISNKADVHPHQWKASMDVGGSRYGSRVSTHWGEIIPDGIGAFGATPSVYPGCQLVLRSGVLDRLTSH